MRIRPKETGTDYEDSKQTAKMNRIRSLTGASLILTLLTSAPLLACQAETFEPGDTSAADQTQDFVDEAL